MDGWMDGWMNEWMDRYVDGVMDENWMDDGCNGTKKSFTHLSDEIRVSSWTF